MIEYIAVTASYTGPESFQSEFTSARGGFTGVDVHAWLRGQWYAPEVGDLTITRPEGLAVIAPVRKPCGVSRERDRAPGLGGAITERDLREGRADGLPLRHLEVVPGDDPFRNATLSGARQQRQHMRGPRISILRAPHRS